MDIQVVQAEDADFEPWLQLAGEVEPLFGPLVRNSRFLEALRKNIARGSAFCVRASVGPAGAPLPGGLLWSVNQPRCEIGWLAVSSSTRRRGIGRALVQHAVCSVKAPAVVSVKSFAEDFAGGEAARAFYKRLGFVECVAPAAEHEHGRQWFELAVTNLHSEKIVEPAFEDKEGAVVEPWDVFHSWEWFRRSQWLSTFRESKRAITAAVRAVLVERGCAGGIVLDCSCGLGLHTTAFHEAGLRVHGADRSAFAVSRAQELARTAGYGIPFVRTSWHELPNYIEQRVDTIFCDALSWTATPSEFQAALEGFRAALRPGGVLLFLGAPQGTPSDRGRQLLLERYQAAPRHSLDWHHTEGPITCTKMSFCELGDDFLDRHHLFLVEETGVQRLERATIRESVQWSWERLVQLFSEAGFHDLSTFAVQRWSSMGMLAGLNVAVR